MSLGVVREHAERLFFSPYTHQILSAYSLFTRKEVRTREKKYSRSEVSKNCIAKKFEKSNSGDIYGHKDQDQFPIFYFLPSLKNVYLRTVNGISTKTVSISINNNTSLNFF
jgi:hypothetical protein